MTVDLERKLDVLREHCANAGRDYEEIEKPTSLRWNPAPVASPSRRSSRSWNGSQGWGVAHAHTRLPGAPEGLRVFSERITREPGGSLSDAPGSQTWTGARPENGRDGQEASAWMRENSGSGPRTGSSCT
ncbi:hypothetical protein GCM10010472_65380 [Pseudonocardia halophobica]|uniref:Uncharacterized protein n=1 Tax=Pseudonocardia halophobica TaxID=29401 RepID=A0A9W6LBC8_9PSEU|nr:hypothetical protein GCM10017577_51340 [Pseudonocardia halophobica]